MLLPGVGRDAAYVAKQIDSRVARSKLLQAPEADRVIARNL
jgi:hypothetical protein